MAALASSRISASDFHSRSLQAICDEFGLDIGIVYRSDHGCRRFDLVASHGLSESVAVRLATLPVRDSSPLRAVCSGQARVLTYEDDAPEIESRFAFELDRSDLRWIIVPMRGGDRVAGLLALFGQGRLPFSEAEREGLETIAYLLAAEEVAEEGRASLERERDTLRHDLRFSHALLRSAEAMGEKADLGEVLDSLASVVFEELGRTVLVSLVSRTASELTVVAAAGPGVLEERQFSIDTLDPVLRQSLMERRAVVIEAGPGPSALGMPSGRFLSVPLMSEGALMGSIEVDDPPTSADDLARETRLLQGIAFEAASAIANARLYEQQRRSASLRDSLNEINALLNEGIDRPHLLEPVLQRTASAFFADSAMIALNSGDRWVIEHVTGDSPQPAGEELCAADVANAKNALRAHSPVLLRASECQRPEGTGLVLVIPLQLRHRPFGAMIVHRDRWVEALDSETLDFAVKLGTSVSLALGNRDLYEQEHRVAETLQEALLSVPESVHGLAMAHLYRPATEKTLVGGDFYDVFEMSGGRVALAIGDVSGKGIQAAGLTALAKNAIKAHAVEGLPPGEVLRKANDITYRFSSMETFFTVFFGVLDPSSGELRFANGGHPSPIAFKPGSARPVEGEGSLVGAFSSSEFLDAVTTIGPDETLLMYTDGLIEARSPSGELFGEERLQELLSELPAGPVADIPVRVMMAVEEFTQNGLSDDLALLVVRLDRGSRTES